MGTLIKKVVTRPMPVDARIVTREGKRIAQWKDRRDKKRTAEVTIGKDGTQRIKTEAATWTAKYRDGEDIVREVATGCKDKQAALSVLTDLTKRAELVRIKVVSPDQDMIADHQSTLLFDHITSYIDHLRSRGVHSDRIKTTETRMMESAKGCGFRWLSDLNVDRLERWLGTLVESTDDHKPTRQVSASVYNGFTEVWVAFGFWCIGKRMTGKRSHFNGDKRLLVNPFEGMRRKDAKQDRRRIARAMTEAELRRLLSAARRRPLLDAVTVRTGPNAGEPLAKVSDERRTKLQRLGCERAMIYKTFVLTGLRADELRTLKCRDLSFGDVPFVKLRHSNEKSRKGSTLALRSDLAAELREWIEEREPDDRVFNVPVGILRIMNRDLELAGIEKESDGCVVHIHALRHSFGTHLSLAGVTPRVAQAAMRHSDISLTMNTYTDARLLDTAEAVESLPSLSIGDDGAETLPRMVAPLVALNPGKQSKSGSTADHCGEFDGSPKARKNPAKANISQGFDESGRQDLNLRPLRPERSALPG